MAETLRVQRLSLATYDGRALLRGMSLEVPPRGAVHIAGRSGAGKSTLLRALAALHPFEGELRLGGESPESLGTPRWRRRVTLVAQRPRLFEGDVTTNLQRPFRYAAAEASYDAERATAMLRALELPPDVLAREARSLSVGEQQRVCLVRGLLHRPRVALLDEPTSALDSASRACVRALLERERAAGTALVLVTHDDLGLPDTSSVDLEAFRA